MAVPANVVSVEEYLNSSWRPGKEYVDGVLVERSAPTVAHSVLQMILIESTGSGSSSAFWRCRRYVPDY
jgi:hypothetical protein